MSQKELDILRKEIKKSETFCFYPFLELSTRPNGSVFPCCYYDEKLALSKLDRISDESPIDNFWNSKKMIHIRNTVAANKPLIGCNICYRDGNSSMRARSVREYINNIDVLNLVNETIKNDGYANHTAKILELKPNNLCNLKCIMCNAYDSSQIEKELNELGRKYHGIKVSDSGRLREINIGIPGAWLGENNNYMLPDMSEFDWAESPEFWSSLEKILPSIEILSFAGGEPTINPIVNKILEYCVEKDFAKNIHVLISSNFTNLNKKFFQLMPEYKKFELIASIDGMGEVQEYTRFPSNWTMIESNFLKAKDYMKYPNVKILTNITVNILTIAYLPKLLSWIEEHAESYPYYNEWPYNINLINYPKELRIDWIPPHMRSQIINDLVSYQQTSSILTFFPELKNKTDLLLNQLQNVDYDIVESRKQLYILKKILTTLDEHRGVSYKTSLPFVNEMIDHFFAI